jgi:hypothetical protein
MFRFWSKLMLSNYVMNLDQKFYIMLSYISLYIHKVLVWTPCLMHRCVCIWRYILQNYNYKLHFQNLSIYHIPLSFWFCQRTAKAAKALSCCAMSARIRSCMSSGIVWRIYVGFVADIDIKILGVPPPRAGHAFPKQRHMHIRGEVIYFCQGFPPYMMPSMDGWWDEWMDGSCDEKSFTKNDHNVLYHM